ncbi:response regulator transcription factor [Parasphaerochaeta coccoides]|uniref:Two component transcriptional regulator, winged helix family n=1 Tax=Parasphaerochaeta coccoides (strain ATCC BAA-1237 / DSM 17374 / SPN1) TaxID=760011 RepID=F4GHN9_PARC1|nr:response regulator transcription factor [Parasphaerochaeta coccoides]AEC01577.1 two component transcriptional regulator, winged helix family [Parasphaerochaeta coccoides DSM 17374]
MKIIYIVEDHEAIREGVAKYLRMSGYETKTFGTLAEAKNAFEKMEPDLLIQDVMLPDGDGFTFVRDIRMSSDCPVIFMTARITESDRIFGFELGADDYITKPFSPKEMVLRIEAVFRRVDAASSPVVSSVDVSVWMLDGSVMKMNDTAHQLLIDGSIISLTVAEWKVLGYLARNAGSVVSRDMIIQKCFGYSTDSYRRVVDTHVKNLRTKLGDAREWIETVRRYGYKFIGVPAGCKDGTVEA